MEEAIKKAFKTLIELEYITVNPLIRAESLPIYFLAEIEKIDWRTMNKYLKS